MGPNGIGKSTLLKIIMGHLAADAGTATWGYETYPGYFAQDQREQFDAGEETAENWVWRFCADRDLGFVRGRMGLMLFSGDDGKKRLSTLSGGEASRLVFTKLSIEHPNVLVLDEPTNHLDLESIEALVEGLKAYDGTLVFVSHDRWFVSQLATRILEIRPDGITDYPGAYEDYVHACGDDHLDVDRVVLKAKKERRQKTPPVRRPATGKSKAELTKAQERLETVTAKMEAAESRVAAIDAMFCEPDYFARTPGADVRALEEERKSLQGDVAGLLTEWEALEAAIAELE